MNGKPFVVGLVIFIVAATFVYWNASQQHDDRMAALEARPAFFTEHTTYESALEAATTEGRLLIVDVTAEWCGPCKEMDKTTWPEPEVAEWMKANAEAFQMDLDTHAEFATEHNISAIPLVLVFDVQSGVVLDRQLGGVDAGTLLAFLDGAKMLGDAMHSIEEETTRAGDDTVESTPEAELPADESPDSENSEKSGG